LAASIIAWLLTMLFLSPRVAIIWPEPDGVVSSALSCEVLIANRSFTRSLIDVRVACSLRIPTSTGENDLTLQTSGDSYPIVPPRLQRRVTISMDPQSLTPFA
jgi:hypothetical protein